MRHIILAGVAVLAATSLARGDGCLVVRHVGDADALVSSPKQEAILAFDGSTVEITLRTHFRADAPEVGWVVPVPAKPTRVRTRDVGVFAALHAATTPRFTHTVDNRKPTLTCAPGPSPVQLGHGLTLEAVGTAGIYEWKVLRADGAEPLIDWLRENRYALPEGSEPCLRHYVGCGWYWLALKVRADAAGGPLRVPEPVAYAYKADELVYPLVISRISAAESNEVLLYVIATAPFAPTNWRWLGLQQAAGKLALDPASPSGTTYGAWVAAETAHRGGRLFVCEYAERLDESPHPGKASVLLALLTAGSPLEGGAVWLGRFRAVMAPEAMDRDVRLAPAGFRIHEWPELDVGGTAMAPAEQPVLATLGVGVLALAAVRFVTGARPWWARLLGVATLAAAAILPGML